MEDLGQGQGQDPSAEEPDKVSVVVHGAKNLQSKKKGRCKFSVIFGIGSKKFRTDVVEDVFGSPNWNTEAEIDVDNASHPLTLTVTEKDDTLGQILVPLNELPSMKPYLGKKVSLGPHKKCPDPVGELIVSAWVSATRSPREPKSSPSGALKSLKKMKSKISHSPLLRRKSKNGESPQSVGMKGSMSMGDLAGSGRRKTNLLSIPSDSMCSVNSTDSDSSNQLSASCVDIRESLKKPEVSGISPKEGPAEGGTRLTVRGINLGRSREDVIGLSVCGCDCLPSLEYESTSKLYCVTGKHKAGAGDIVVETTSGGRGSSMVQFTYVNKDSSSQSPSGSKRMSPLVMRRKSPSLGHKKRSSDTSTLSTGSLTASIPEEQEEKPEVSGISPKEGPIEGGTRLTIRGHNLGRSRDDVTAVTVCGKDCLSTLEYENSHKLFVTTKAWKPCSGDIIIETKSGGRGSSTVQYTYTMPAASLPSPSPAAMRRVEQSLDLDIDPERLLRESAPSPAFSDDDDDDDDASLLKPEVTGISPKEGPAEGGTRLTIRGINLGKNKADVVGITINGANCLPMLEYESGMKLYCTTPPWKVGAGHIIIETKAGGKGSSLVQFTYKRSSPSVPSKSSPAPAAVPAATMSTVASPAPDKPPRKSQTPTPSQQDASPPKEPPLTNTPLPSYPLTPNIVIKAPTPSPPHPATAPVSGVTVDETDDFGGAVPYPDDPGTVGYPADTRGVDSAPTGTAAMPSSARMSQSLVTVDTQQSPGGMEARPQPLGHEVKVARENKRQAPLPPSHQKPPMYPTEHRTSPSNQGNPERQTTPSRQLPTPPGDNNKQHRDRNQDEEKHATTKGNNFLSTITGQDKKEKYILDHQQGETQSGPTRQELMEEIRRVKLENRELRDQNHMMKQYLENILSHVMTRCPDVLCVDHGNPG